MNSNKNNVSNTECSKKQQGHRGKQFKRGCGLLGLAAAALGGLVGS